MEKLQIRKADKKQTKMRVGVTAPSGGGKTYSALLLAKGLVGDWNKIALIDTENGSGELYSHLGDYSVITLKAPFAPERYIDAIKVAEDAGFEVIIIDSATHEWDGRGGCLEIQEQLGGRFQDWAKVTPRHRKFLESIIQSSVHIITTTRRKQDYGMDRGRDGKLQVEKLGLKEVQRDGFEYELTLNIEIDIRHNAKASKDRTGLFMDKPEFIVTEDTGKTLRKWCEEGKEDFDSEKIQITRELKRLGIEVVGQSKEQAESLIKTLTGIELKEPNFKKIIDSLKTLKKDEVDKILNVLNEEGRDDDGFNESQKDDEKNKKDGGQDSDTKVR